MKLFTLNYPIPSQFLDLCGVNSENIAKYLDQNPGSYVRVLEQTSCALPVKVLNSLFKKLKEANNLVDEDSDIDVGYVTVLILNRVISAPHTAKDMKEYISLVLALILDGSANVRTEAMACLLRIPSASLVPLIAHVCESVASYLSSQLPGFYLLHFNF